MFRDVAISKIVSNKNMLQSLPPFLTFRKTKYDNENKTDMKHKSKQNPINV